MKINSNPASRKRGKRKIFEKSIHSTIPLCACWYKYMASANCGRAFHGIHGVMKDFLFMGEGELSGWCTIIPYVSLASLSPRNDSQRDFSRQEPASIWWKFQNSQRPPDLISIVIWEKIASPFLRVMLASHFQLSLGLAIFSHKTADILF